MGKIKLYLSLVKFSHTLFAMPFAIVGFFIATNYYNYGFDIETLVYVLLCMVFVRNAAMAFNRYVDKRIDKENERTSSREIPKGVIKPSNALIFVIINSVAFIVVTWFINRLCFYLSPIVLLVVLGYSFTKRFTFISHYILGIGLGLAPIGAFLAVSGEFRILPILLSIAVWAWVSGFDIIYSVQDEEFDRQNRLFSIPAHFGVERALCISRLTHCMSAAFIIATIFVGGFGYKYVLAVSVFCGLLIYQHIIVKADDLSRVDFAFFNLNGLASVLFAILAVWELLEIGN